MSKDNLTEKDKELTRVIELKLDKTIKDLEDTYNNYVKEEDKDNG